MANHVLATQQSTSYGALAALVAAAGGGSLAPLAMYAVQTAADPQYQLLAKETSRTGLDMAARAFTSYGQYEWFVVVLGFIVAILSVALAITCCGQCGFLGFMGGHEWATRRGHQARPVGGLANMAAFITNGGQPAIAQLAKELNVSEQAVSEWWVHWQFAQRGPRRV